MQCYLFLLPISKRKWRQFVACLRRDRADPVAQSPDNSNDKRVNIPTLYLPGTFLTPLMCRYLHFIDEETKTGRTLVTCLIKVSQ